MSWLTILAIVYALGALVTGYRFTSSRRQHGWGRFESLDWTLFVACVVLWPLPAIGDFCEWLRRRNARRSA